MIAYACECVYVSFRCDGVNRKRDHFIIKQKKVSTTNSSHKRGLNQNALQLHQDYCDKCLYSDGFNADLSSVIIVWFM